MTIKTLRQWAGLQTPHTLDAARTALILIDFQGEYFDAEKVLIPNGAHAARNAALLMNAAEEFGVKVIHIQHVAASASSTLFAPASPLTEFVDPVKPRPGQDVIVKSMPSSFVRTTLDDTLRSAGIETVVICGLATHMCVDSTTRDAVSGGYKAIVAHDACASRDLPGPDGAPISGDVVHRATLAALGDRFADVTSTAEVIARFSR